MFSSVTLSVLLGTLLIIATIPDAASYSSKYERNNARFVELYDFIEKLHFHDGTKLSL